MRRALVTFVLPILAVSSARDFFATIHRAAGVNPAQERTAGGHALAIVGGGAQVKDPC